jgi:hypothetical protein
MAESDLACTPLEIGDVDLVNTRLFGQVDLPPAPLLSELPDSIAKLDANIGVHSSSIDLVEALYLVDALSRPNRDADAAFGPNQDDERHPPAIIDNVRAVGGTSLHPGGLMMNSSTKEQSPECHALLKMG